MIQSGPSKDEIERLLGSVLRGDATILRPWEGFVPFGGEAECPGCDPGEIPQTPDELAELVSYTYDLTVRRAAELNIPVIGSVSGGFERRVVVYEWTRY